MARRRPRLFAFPREVELRDLRQWATDPEEVRLWTGVVDAFAAIAKSKTIEDGQLGAFLAAATHSSSTLRGLAMTRLSVLCHYFPEAVDAYARLLAHPDASLRQFAVLALSNTPKATIVDRLPAALADTEWTVRRAAAQVASALPLPALTAFLEAREQVETDARVRVVLQLAIQHQRSFETP